MNAEGMIAGYVDRQSVRPGERLRFMVHCQRDPSYQADLVQLLHGDADPAGPGVKEKVIPSAISGQHSGRPQRISSGSYLRVRAMPALDRAALTLQVVAYPTTPSKTPQALLGRWCLERQAGFALVLEADELTVWLGDGEGAIQRVSSERRLETALWYLLAVSLDRQAGELTLHQLPLLSLTQGRFSLSADPDATASVRHAPFEVFPDIASETPFLLAAAGGTANGKVGAHFNGRLERPRVVARVLDEDSIRAAVKEPPADGLIAAWEFDGGISARGVSSTHVKDASPNALHAEAVNLPTRAVAGHNWSSEEHAFHHAPEQYAAIHFHDDDLVDAGWDVDFQLDVDRALPSGVYAARLQGRDWREYVPFYVRPPASGPHAPIALLIPTASYMAYANGHTAINAPLGEPIIGHAPVLEAFDLFLDEHREYGLSLYDTHSDGSGVCYSSRLRPILTQRPQQGAWQSPSVWQFNADLHIVDWLTERGHTFDVLTDEDLDREGLDAIEPYRVVLTGTHPEYVSSRMLDGLHDHLNRGGRLMYLGGNGFYWVIAFDSENREVIEVRRFGGSQSWQISPGEGYLSTSGERGGIWRTRGRAPQRLVGVGFASEGFDVCSYYRRREDSFNPRAAWIFDGVSRDERIGDFGLVGAGAAGLEMDIYDTSLGTPPHALLLASSEGHTDNYLEVLEELSFNTPGISGTQSPKVRADMVYFETPNGGGVFSVGSIAWCGSLSYNAYNNNVSRITENVLRRFKADDPLPPPP